MSDPLQSGLAAGQAAYSGAAPKRMGISAADLSSVRNSVNSGISTAAAQRQMVDTNAAKQAAGAYPTSGTSAAMYNYLRGQGGYPVNAVPSGQPVNTGNTGYGGIGTLPGLIGNTVIPGAGGPGGPIQKPYEKVVNTGDPTQTKIAEQAKTDPTKMGTRTSGAINIPKPSTMQQILGVAGPAYLGYSLLDKTGGLDALSSGYNYLFGSPAKSSLVDTLSPTITDQLYQTNPYAVSGPPVQIADASGSGLEYLAGDAAVDAGAGAGVDASLTSVANGYGTSVVDGAGLTYAGGATVPASSTAIFDAAGTQLAPDVGAYFAGVSTPVYDYAATEGAAALGAEAGLGSMLGTYGPYVAAAYLADQYLLDGAISEGIGDVVSGVGGALEDVASGVGDFFGDVSEDIGCYITTAATKYGGQADDGEVLNTLRRFRDTYMRKDAEKNKDVDWYYKNAPKIVNAIDKMPESDVVYQKLYKQYILPAYYAIKKGENARAFKLYKSLVKQAESVAGLHRGKELTKRYNGGGLTALADGGQLGGYDISVGSRYDPSVDGISQANPNMSFQPTVGRFANGGPTNLGGYSDGGRLLRGPGDGVSDSIPATIGNKQPARLADGEFVVPARIVSEIGNGSTEAGARKLYAMMDRVQKARSKTVGKGKVAKNTRADKYLPA